jgi:hypothetical protein
MHLELIACGGRRAACMARGIAADTAATTGKQNARLIFCLYETRGDARFFR